jgi:hypothetical protein
MGSVLEVEIEMARRGRKKRFHTEGTEAGAQRTQRKKTQEHSQEWLCHRGKRNPRGRRKAAPTFKSEESGEKRKMFVIG